MHFNVYLTFVLSIFINGIALNPGSGTGGWIWHEFKLININWLENDGFITTYDHSGMGRMLQQWIRTRIK